MAPAPTGASISPRMGARHRPNKTPASTAFASGPGTDATSRPNGLNSPAATIRRPTTRNAPTAAGNPPAVAPVAARSAAPGVDQAPEIGIRYATLRPIPATPIAIDRAIRPEAASALLAPTAVSPLMITAKDEANPTNAVMIPATIGCVGEYDVIGPRLPAERFADSFVAIGPTPFALSRQISDPAQPLTKTRYAPAR